MYGVSTVGVPERLQFGEADSTAIESRVCTAVKMCFSHLKKGPRKKHMDIRLSAHYIWNIFTTIPCHQTALYDGNLRALYPSLKATFDSFDILLCKTQELLVCYCFDQLVCIIISIYVLKDQFKFTLLHTQVLWGSSRPKTPMLCKVKLMDL